MKTQWLISKTGWWWAVGMWVPFAIYSMPFIVGDFQTYRYLTIAALAGRLDVAGLHISAHLSTWQVHAVTGLVYMLLAPFQFSGSFRARHAGLHRRMGYVFMCAAAVLGVTGSTTMLRHSEFGILGRAFMGAAGVANVLGVAMAICAARHRRILTHRRWMIRTVVMGYTVISTRIALVLLQRVLCIGFGIPVVKAADYSMLAALVASNALVELYIHRYVRSDKAD